MVIPVGTAEFNHQYESGIAQHLLQERPDTIPGRKILQNKISSMKFVNVSFGYRSWHSYLIYTADLIQGFLIWCEEIRLRRVSRLCQTEQRKRFFLIPSRIYSSEDTLISLSEYRNIDDKNRSFALEEYLLTTNITYKIRRYRKQEISIRKYSVDYNIVEIIVSRITSKL